MLCQSNWCAPRIAVRRALRHTVRPWAVVGKNDWQFSNPRIDTDANRLKKLALPSLAYRRKRGDMIEVYKYTHGLYKVSALPVEMEENTTRGHKYKLKKRGVPPLED